MKHILLLLAMLSALCASARVPVRQLNDADLLGNWFNSTNNAYVVSLYPNTAVYDGQYWNYQNISQSSKGTSFTLQLNGVTRHILITQSGADHYLSENKQVLAITRTYDMKRSIGRVKDTGLVSPLLYHTDSVTYTGYIYGFPPEATTRMGHVYVNDAETGMHDDYDFLVEKDGSFTVKFPLQYAKECSVQLPFHYYNIYFEPGGKVFQSIDIQTSNTAATHFMGRYAKVNEDLEQIRDITRYYEDGDYEKARGMKPQQFKDFNLDRQQWLLQKIDEQHALGVGKKAFQLARMHVQFAAAGELMMVNYRLFPRTNNLKEKLAIAQQVVRADTAYCDFIKALPANDPRVLCTENFSIYLNRIAGVSLPALMDGDSTVDGSFKKLMAMDSLPDYLLETADHYAGLRINSGRIGEVTEQYKAAVMRRAYQKEVNLELALLASQQICEQLKNNFTPLSDDSLAVLKKQTGYSFIYNGIVALNNSIKKKQEEDKRKHDYKLNAVGTASDTVFSSIIAPYKGRLLVVDLWATWCGPCLASIEKYKPLKEELKNQPVTFIYITNHTSPENLYKSMITDIKGEHFRLNENQWQVLSKTFGLAGIPHYIIVDRDGEVIYSKTMDPDVALIKQKLNL